MDGAGDLYDAEFIDSMIVHHQGAIDMANAVLAQSQRPELVQLATAIIIAQTSEIAQMQEWRTAWYPDLPPTRESAWTWGRWRSAATPANPSTCASSRQ